MCVCVCPVCERFMCARMFDGKTPRCQDALALAALPAHQPDPSCLFCPRHEPVSALPRLSPREARLDGHVLLNGPRSLQTHPPAALQDPASAWETDGEHDTERESWRAESQGCFGWGEAKHAHAASVEYVTQATKQWLVRLAAIIIYEYDVVIMLIKRFLLCSPFHCLLWLSEPFQPLPL